MKEEKITKDLEETYLGRILIVINSIFLLSNFILSGCGVSIYTNIFQMIGCKIAVMLWISLSIFYWGDMLLYQLLIRKGKITSSIIRILVINMIFTIGVVIYLIKYTVLAYHNIVCIIHIVDIICLVYYGTIIQSNWGKKKVIDLKSYKDDRIYVPELLKKIKDETLQKWIANEVLSYVYGAYKYKRVYYFFVTISIILTAVIAAFGTDEISKGNGTYFIITIMSVAAVVITGVMNTMKAKESWIRYRTYAELAKTEIFEYVFKIESYAPDKIQDINIEKQNFIKKLKQIFNTENNKWQEMRNEN